MAKADDRFERRYERKRESKDTYQKSLPGEDEAPLPPPVDTIRNESGGPKRNEPCPCGSGKKYKKCCGLES